MRRRSRRRSADRAGRRIIAWHTSAPPAPRGPLKHFALLGLLWGAAWLLLAYVAHRQSTKPIISGKPTGPAVVTADDYEETLTSNTARDR